MSELCLLGFHERARQSYLFNGQIPRNCLDCIQAEVDKPPVQLRLTFIGVRGLINVVEMIKALDADKTVNIGLKWDDVHGRRLNSCGPKHRRTLKIKIARMRRFIAADRLPVWRVPGRSTMLTQVDSYN